MLLARKQSQHTDNDQGYSDEPGEPSTIHEVESTCAHWAGQREGAITPFAIGWMWSELGNYDVAFTLLGAGWFFGGVIVLLAREPREPVSGVQKAFV